MKNGLSYQIRKLMETPYMYSVSDIMEITGKSERSVASMLANLQNQYRCGAPGPLTLKTIKYPDGIKRWGNLDAGKIYGENCE